ncbi:MAG: ATP-grasp domain-containing protein, partial [Phycisphaeraceae bacterium]|nr:ATP-grasp domain-containing protein [Phycisphaeraceae bacterium]
MSETDKGRVVLTHGRSLQALAAAQSLGRQGIEVIGCDEASMTVLDFSRYVHATFTHPPERDREGFLLGLIKGIEQHRPEDGRPYVLMPMHREALVLAEARDRLEPHIRLALPDQKSIDRVFPKDRLIETSRELELPIPETTILDAQTSADQVDTGSLEFPLFTKPTVGAGGRGIRRVEKAVDLEEAVAEARSVDPSGRVLIQSFIEGDNYCFTGLFEGGRMRAHMTYRNLRTFPGDSGPGVIRETVEAEPARRIAEKLMASIRWHGVAQVDFRWTGEPSDDPVLIEVNPRFWSGLFQSLESGVDYPWLLYRLMVEGTVPDAPPPALGTRTKVPLLVALSAIESFL